jgi:Flp pilus assembly secretin CpaC
MTLIVLVLLGLMVLVVTVAPPDQGARDRAEATVAPSPPDDSLTDPDAFDVSAKLSTADGAEAKTVDAEVGDRVEITVEGESADSVALGDLSVDDVEAGSPARFELLADTPGTYPITLLNENRRLGTLEIH